MSRKEEARRDAQFLEVLNNTIRHGGDQSPEANAAKRIRDEIMYKWQIRKRKMEEHHGPHAHDPHIPEKEEKEMEDGLAEFEHQLSLPPDWEWLGNEGRGHNAPRWSGFPPPCRQMPRGR